MGHFFHAVGVFFHHLAAVQWQFLGYAIACHVVKLVLRAGAWRAIVNAAYPDARLKFRSAFGAYIAGVGVNSIVPARGGDVVKLYLVRHRIPGSSYATLTPTLIVETLFDFVTAGALIIWALASGVLPTHQLYSRIPAVDWKFFLRHEHFTAIALAVLRERLANTVRDFFGSFGATLGTLSPFCSVFAAERRRPPPQKPFIFKG